MCCNDVQNVFQCCITHAFCVCVLGRAGMSRRVPSREMLWDRERRDGDDGKCQQASPRKSAALSCY